jgi:unsaturated rhamnogalacturonyl hydrolase
MPRSGVTPAIDTARPPWSLRIAASALSRYPVDSSHWHYKYGLLYKGIFHLWQQTGASRFWDSLKSYADHFVAPSGEIKTYSVEEYNIDQINPGKLLFPLYKETGEERYRQALWHLKLQIDGQPRTHEGGFWHKKIYPFQMWLDGIYMASPFYAEFAATFDGPAAFDDIAFQITSIEQHTRDARTGLLYHGWDESRAQAWADPTTGCSPHFWSRAIGWYVMALVDVLDHFPPDHPARQEFIAVLQRTLTAVARYQDEATGLWWQILDQSQRPGNYLEASGSSMYVYAIAKGVRSAYLDQHWLTVANKAFDGLIKHMVTVDEAGQVDLHGTCTSAGLGGSPYRDGSFEYYISEPIATNDLHGVGAFLLAATEMEYALTRSTE